MKKVFIIGLVAAELAMVARALPEHFSPGMSIEPPAIDAKWARMMDRKADLEAREDAARTARRRAIEACIGPSGPSLTTARYEKKEKACEARLSGRTAATQAKPAQEPREYYRPPPSALQPLYPAPVPAPAPVEPAPTEAAITISGGEIG